ncbi:aminotransferase class IV [Clostridium hydrogeniformans]|uniref:aminotransferase class IV n=1 Tax=Clostridium hydrogeniformans TaxID=349933 RepID=UPI0004803D90|nr:aminotransferase class IV [Clostridium hydrogeniformans]
MKILDEKNNIIYLDNGFNFGLGAFETIKVTSKGYGVLLKEHIERLNNSLKILEIDESINHKSIEQIIKDNKIKNCGLKIVVTDKNQVISLRDITYKKEDYYNGFNLKVSDYRRNSKSLLVYHKTLNYGENILEKRRASKEGFQEVIFLNEEDKLSEGAVSNLFFINNNRIYTPKVRCGLLNGVIRQWIIRNFNVIEGEYTLKDLLESQGAFLSNSLMGIMPINKVGDINIKRNSYIDDIRKSYLSFEGEMDNYDR